MSATICFFLTLTDKRGRGGLANADIEYKGGRGGLANADITDKSAEKAKHIFHLTYLHILIIVLKHCVSFLFLKSNKIVGVYFLFFVDNIIFF